MSSVSLSEQSGWAGQLLDAVGDTSTSTGSVVGWLQTNLGQLNRYLSTDFLLEENESEELEIVPELSSIQSGIYNEMFICHWLKKQSRLMLGAMEYDWTEMVGDQQGKIKIVSKTQKAESYRNLAKDCDNNLKDLVKDYKGGTFMTPRNLLYNNRISTPQDIRCGCFNWSPCNPIYSE